MTLATITAFINNNIRNKTPKVIKTEHANVEQALANELFPSTITETSLSHIITTPVGSDLTYELYFKKNGSFVDVFGIITVVTPHITSSSFLSITDTLYQQKIFITPFNMIRFEGTKGNSDDKTFILFSNNGMALYTENDLAFGDKILFNGRYSVND